MWWKEDWHSVYYGRFATSGEVYGEYFVFFYKGLFQLSFSDCGCLWPLRRNQYDAQLEKEASCQATLAAR